MGVLAAPEAFPDIAELRFGYTATMVGDVDSDEGITVAGLDAYLAAIGIFDGVVEDIAERLGCPAQVEVSEQVGGAGVRSSGM